MHAATDLQNTILASVPVLDFGAAEAELQRAGFHEMTYPQGTDGHREAFTDHSLAALSATCSACGEGGLLYFHYRRVRQPLRSEEHAHFCKCPNCGGWDQLPETVERYDEQGATR